MYFHEIPNIDETLYLLDKFRGGPLAYWHDVGHAEVFVRLGLAKNHEFFLEKLSPSMAGMHLHDIKKFDDHFAPGSGEFDFDILKKYISPETIKVMEVHSKASRTDIEEAKKCLLKAGIVSHDAFRRAECQN